MEVKHFVKQPNMNYPHKLLQAYGMACKSLCQELKMPQTAFDILMFLANNPDFHTARDIAEIRGIKANLISMNVEKLVREELLERRPVPGDRRKTMLICTPKAKPIIETGRRLQENFYNRLFENIDEASREIFHDVMKGIERNLDKMLEGCDLE